MTDRCSVALVIRHPGESDQLLLVQRPDDDEDLPGAWGLPAASLRKNESWEDAACRAGCDKLGVDLEPGLLLNEGVLARADYRLVMRLLEAHITGGDVKLDAGPDDGTTRYQAWRWGELADLRPAAQQGSLCSRLALEALGERPG